MPQKKVLPKLEIRNAKLLYRNFKGEETKFNPAGMRNFCVILDEKSAESLLKDGWNVKTRPPRDPQDDKIYYIQVKVSYARIPPTIWLITRKGKTRLGEDDIKVLDWAEFENLNLVINPSPWEVGGKTGVKGYLRTMYATLLEDTFADEYSDVPDVERDVD
jgi:hypothetical protein